MKLKLYSKLSAQVLFGCLLTTSLAQNGKRFILYSTAHSWNEAAKVCEDNGGLLAELDTYSSAYLLQDFQTNSKKINNYVWIGLTDVAQLANSLETKGFAWSSCQTASWFNWDQHQPLITWENWCAKLVNSNGYRWAMEKCSSQIFFLCEQTIGSCEYTTVIDTCDLNSLTTQDVNILSLADCLDNCQSYSGTNGTRCWAYQLLLQGLQCRLYLGQTPVYCESGGAPVSGDSTQIRMCYAVTYNQTQNPPILRNTDDHPKNCTPPKNFSQITTTPLGSTANMITALTLLESTTATPESETMTTITTITASQALQTSSSLTTQLTVTSDTTTAATTTGTSPTTAAVSLSSAAPSTTGASSLPPSNTTPKVDPKPSSTTAAPENKSPARKKTACGCVCIKPVTLSLPQVLENVQQLQTALTLNKSSLSSTRRKKESAPDHRPSAQATGGLGIALLMVPVLIIVLPDLHSALAVFWGKGRGGEGAPVAQKGLIDSDKQPNVIK